MAILDSIIDLMQGVRRGVETPSVEEILPQEQNLDEFQAPTVQRLLQPNIEEAPLARVRAPSLSPMFFPRVVTARSTKKTYKRVVPQASILQSPTQRVKELPSGTSPFSSLGFLSKILPFKAPITQTFGARSPVERYSRGINYGVDFAVPKGTKVAIPPGNWAVLDSFGGARHSGPFNPQMGINRGYGNSVLVYNRDTGERLRFSHLSKVAVKKGQSVKGGTVVGLSGATGNVAGRTGQHLDLEYYDATGRPRNVLTSTYGRYL